MNILVINAGSSSMKYQLIDMTEETVIAKGICERIGIDGKMAHKTNDGRAFEKSVDMINHTEAFKQIEQALCFGHCAVIEKMSDISAVGHRVVQGGAMFSNSVLLDDVIIEKIESLNDLAPLHNPAHIQGIRACRQALGYDVPQVAVFDTAFHSTMPEEAYMYAIPYEYYEKHQIRRYGFHGTSHKFVSHKCAEMLGSDLKDLKMITCHLGNGSSLAAIKDGKVIDTSMGLTPLDGFMMGTRCGAIDPSIVTYLMEKENWTSKEVSDVLNKKSGMLGISGISSDDRDVSAQADNGNKRAVLAQNMLAYQIKKLVGAYAAAMGGLDVIVFTGGIGENVFRVRRQVCEGLEFLGVEINLTKNDETRHGADGDISESGSAVRVMVVPTNEELVIARDTKEIVNSK